MYPILHKVMKLSTSTRHIFIEIGFKVILGIVILVGFHILSRSVHNYILLVHQRKQALTGKKQDSNLIVNVFAKVVYFALLFMGVIIILRLFGLEITSIIAIISAIGFVIGLSLQGTFSDIASGILLALFQTYNVGDIITIDDVEGKVVEFRLVNTLIQDINSGVIVTVPNRKIQDSIINNISKTEYHYVLVDVLLSNTNPDFQKIIDALKADISIVEKYPDVKRNLPFFVAVSDMSEVGTKLRIRVPVDLEGDLVNKRARIRTSIRNLLAQN